MGTQPSPGIDTYLPDHLCEMPDTFYEQLWWSNPASFTTLLSPLVSDANISFISFTNNSHSFQYVLRPILRKHLTSSIQSPHLVLLARNIPKKSCHDKLLNHLGRKGVTLISRRYDIAKSLEFLNFVRIVCFFFILFFVLDGALRFSTAARAASRPGHCNHFFLTVIDTWYDPYTKFFGPKRAADSVILVWSLGKCLMYDIPFLMWNINMLDLMRPTGQDRIRSENRAANQSFSTSEPRVSGSLSY